MLARSPPAIPKRVNLCHWKASGVCIQEVRRKTRHLDGEPRGGGRGPYRPRPARQGPYPERKATRFSTKTS
eukprot:scaffold22954_cov49-Phaeocystis_antarctica.AAC.1